MAITGNEDISIARKEVKESQVGSIQTTKTLIFKHEANAGDLVIDTTALTAPADALANGFIQDNPSSLNLLVNKKNLKIHSSRGVWLQMHEDYKVTGANTIQLIGNIASLGGALEGEVFTIYAVPVQSNSIITTDHKKMHQEYILADGDTVLNLGREFEVNRNPLSQIGAIRIWRNGVGPLLRNVGNATAAPLADGNYQEIDAGNGLGTTIEFNTPASGQDDVIVVEFGLEYAGDFSLVGDIHSIWGSILKLAEDVKDLGPYDITRYLNANPSEVERRAFGDQVLDHEGRIVTLETGKHVLSAFKNNGFSVPGSTNTILSWDGYDADKSRGITVSGSAINFTKAGIYKITIGARYRTDVWLKHFAKNAALAIVADSHWAGGANSPGTFVFMMTVDVPGNYTVWAYGSIGGITIDPPAPTGSPDGQLTRTMTMTIEEM